MEGQCGLPLKSTLTTFFECFQLLHISVHLSESFSTRVLEGVVGIEGQCGLPLKPTLTSIFDCFQLLHISVYLSESVLSQSTGRVDGTEGQCGLPLKLTLTSNFDCFQLLHMPVFRIINMMMVEVNIQERKKVYLSASIQPLTIAEISQ